VRLLIFSVGNFFGGIFWRNCFPPHTKFLQIVEYLRVGGICRGIIPATNSSEAKNAGGMYPISSSPLEEFRNLGGIFLTTNDKIYYHLFLIGNG